MSEEAGTDQSAEGKNIAQSSESSNANVNTNAPVFKPVFNININPNAPSYQSDIASQPEAEQLSSYGSLPLSRNASDQRNPFFTEHEDVHTQKHIGNGYTTLLDWLSQSWLKDGPPVCIVQGFSGVGKTTLARTLLKNSGWVGVIVNMADVESNQADDLLLDLATELSLIGLDEIAIAVENGTSLFLALQGTLRRQILIVVDEFQHALDISGRPMNGLSHLLDRIANRPHFPGRVLLLSGRVVEQSKWSEAYAIRTLTALEPEAAELLLDRLLKENNRSQEVPFERRRDVVNWLGCNPRALRVLVGSLEQDSLDDLIGLSPESWELREREVSPELLSRLERELLKRTLSHLKEETNKLLSQLSVHRKPIKRKAIEMLLPAPETFAAARHDLISHFLMEQHSGWFTLNPIVREIALQRLKKNSIELRHAHSRAADYYTRHFTAKSIVGGGQLGGYFVEARYHLVQAKREKDLTVVAEPFGNHLKASYKLKSSIPRQRDELDERIALLSALLETTGDRYLEYCLARLYQARSADGDLRKSLSYVRRATGLGALPGSWILRIQLEEQLNGSEQALQVSREGIDHTPVDERLIELYSICEQLLMKADRKEEAIGLLKEGIERIPAELGLAKLYESCGQVLTQVGRHEEAISLLKEGINRIPVEQLGLVKLYRAYGQVLAQVSKHEGVGKREEAISLFKEGIDRIPTDKGTSEIQNYLKQLVTLRT